MHSPRVPHNQISSTATDFDFFAALLTVPVGVLVGEHVTVVADSEVVRRRTETADGGEVGAVEFVRAAEDDQAAVIGS